MNLKIRTLLFFSFISLFAVSQKISYSGVVLDSLQNSIEYANITAIPESDSQQIRYSSTDNSGSFMLSLQKNEPYQIIVSHIGYSVKRFKLSISQELSQKIILQERVEELKEVIINYTPPITSKKDTIAYDTDAFVNGNERKLREVLKKLPGIEVDREGNVTAQGKKVTKVLVDGKIFFTGSSKLAVNNIPADAVDKIEILDNYNDIGFLKGLQDSDDMAMNISLKEDKKKFVFGDLEVGAGVKDRYVVHPTLFYYSPKTNINFIGDLNNTGVKSFTTKDYIEFNGGFGKLMGDIKGYLNLFKDDFAQYLVNKDFKENTNRFGAFNLRQSVSSKTDVNTYVIANSSVTETEVQTLNQYNNNIDSFIENRAVTNSLDNFFIIGKVNLDYEPNIKEDLSANSFIKLNKNTSNGNIFTNSPQQNNTFTTLGGLDGVDVRQNLEYSKKFSKAHTISTEATLAYAKNKPNTNWITGQVFLQNLIPLQDDTTFDVLQQKETKNTTFDFLFKDYWVLNNYNHIYTSLGSSLLFENYTTQEEQRLANGAINNFSENGFGNTLDYNLNDTFLGLEYKFLTGIFTVKSGLFYHNYWWSNTQQGNMLRNNTKAVLPAFDIEAEFNSSEKLKFGYKANIRFPDSPRLAGNFLLNNFNTVFRGNENLSNERFHTYNLSYYKFSLFRGLTLNANIFYNKKTQSVKRTTQLQGIEQFATLTMFNRPENNLNGRFNFSKKINNIKYTLESTANYSEFFQIVNDNTSKNISKSVSATGKIETSFDKLPNLELGYTYTPTNYKTDLFIANFKNTAFFGNLEYRFLKDFVVKGEYSKIDFENASAGVSNAFDIANTSLFYQKEDSPWGFEIKATNIFNTQFKRQSSFSDFLISDQSTFILPRIVLFKVSYKL